MSGITNTLGGGGVQNATATPGRSQRRNNGSRGSSGSGGRRNNLSASEIMKGVKSSKEKEVVDPYPGIDAIVACAFKMRPYSNTDEEQRIRALTHLLSGRCPGAFVDRMERDYAKKVALWRANGGQFPYCRAREFRHLPEFKSGAKSMPDWLVQMNEEQARYDAAPEELKQAAAVQVAKEEAEMRKEFALVQFDREDMEWKAVNLIGFWGGRAYRAYRIFRAEQAELLAQFAAKQVEKKVLLAHATQHGELVPNLPKADPPAPKKKEEKAAQAVPKKVQVGSVMDAV